MLLASLLGRPVVALVAPDSTAGAGLIYEAPRACLALSGRHGTTAGSFSEPSPDAVLKAALQLLAR
jgi:ADP-heptose:LPS heptosyltransferase